MSRRPLAAALLVALAAAAAALTLRAGAVVVADGEPNVAGLWSGKASLKTDGLDASVEPEKRKQDATLEIEQDGANLTAVLTLVEEDGPDSVYNLHGQVGNGRFWLQGDTTGLGTPMQVLAPVSVKGITLKTKASGVFTRLDRAGTISLSLSRPAATKR